MPNKLSQFWRELKRRRVIHVIVVYATAAFVILGAVDIIFPRLNFPDWTVTFVMILLAVGFPIALIFSWIFDVTPEGIEKTKLSIEVKKDEITATPNSWKIATYMSVVLIIALLAFNIFGRRKTVEIDESLAKSIAVLPFHNYSGDSDQDFMCEGLTDEIISHLFKVRSFDEVRSLTSVLPYKDSEKSATEIADALQVNYILEGSYKRLGDELKITAQLIESKSDNHVWIQDYKLPYNEVISIPGEIAIQIAEHLKAFLSDSERQIITKVSTLNPQAFELLKQAQVRGADVTSYIMDERVMEAVMKAIELDPDYANAHALMGWITLMKANYGGGSEMLTAGFEAELYLEKALELDPDNPIAHGVMAVLDDWFKWDYIAAERENLRTIELMPHDRMILAGYGGMFLVKMNRTDDAAYILTPLLSYTDDLFYFTYRFNEIRRLVVAGSNQKAFQAIELLLDTWKEDAYIWAANAYCWLGEYTSALHYLELGAGDPEIAIPHFQACLALSYQKAGRISEAQAVVQGLIDWSHTTSAMSPAFYLGWYYSGIGDFDSAFLWLEKAYRNRSPEMPWLKVDPVIANLKEDDRYWDLYERTGHKAYDDYMASKNK